MVSADRVGHFHTLDFFCSQFTKGIMQIKHNSAKTSRKLGLNSSYTVRFPHLAWRFLVLAFVVFFRLLQSGKRSTGLFTSIFTESLATSVVPSPFKKKSVIIRVPKNNKPSCLNDYRPVALTSIVMKVFERIVKNHICSSIPVQGRIKTSMGPGAMTYCRAPHYNN